MVTVGDIFAFINSIAPFDTQESWDNSGLLVGDVNRTVEKVAVCLDVTNDTLDKAIELGVDLVVSHHPVIWEPLKFVPTDSPVSKAIRAGVSIISAHTNWDLAEGGVNDVLAKLIGLSDVTRLSEDGELAMLRVGELKTAVPAKDFAEIVSSALDTVVRVALPDKPIKKIAVCGGAGASFLPDLIGKGVDAFVTGDSKHNDFLDAIDYDISLLAAGHYETETMSMPVLMKFLENEFLSIECTYIESSPVVYIG